MRCPTGGLIDIRDRGRTERRQRRERAGKMEQETAPAGVHITARQGTVTWPDYS